jgi:hypothetical protein
VTQYTTVTNDFLNTNRNIYEVMYLANGANGNVVSTGNPLPVTLGSENITITGNVNFVDTVNVASSPENPVHNHITEVGTSGLLTVPYLPVGGNVNVTNIITITGNVTANGTINVGNLPSTQTVNGTINIGNTVQVNVVNFPATQNVVVTNTPNVNATITGTVTTTVVNGSSDAFGRMRVSEPFTLGDYKHLYGLDPNFIDYTVNGATIAFQTNQAAARLSTSSNILSRAVHQTKFYHHYMPGKSQFILASFNFYDAVENVTKRTGYFDENNGIFFEQAGDGTLSFVVRSFVSGSPVDTRITQDNWNGDKLDGTGPEEWTIDITKTQLLWIDFQWLGVGAVRCGFVHDEHYHLCHTFYHSDNLPTVYMSSPNLPVRCELFNTGTTTGGYFDQICTTVVSEGGYVEAGQDWAVSSPTLRTIASGATLPVLCIRLKPAFKTYDNRMIVRLLDVNVFTTGQNIKYRVLKLPNQAALTGSTWVDVDTDSGVQYNDTATAFGVNNEILNGFAAASTQGNRRVAQGSGKDVGPAAKKNYIVQNIDSTDSEIYAIVVTNIGGSSTTVGVGVQWREVY